MTKQMLGLAALAGVILLATPAPVDAYGAAHVGYTHVGPNGVYHAGATAAKTPSGTYAGGSRSAYGSAGGAYHAGGAAYHTGGGGTAAAGYRYTPSYGGASHYGYVR